MDTEVNVNTASELAAEIAALRCALHALAHVVATPQESADDAVRHFDNLARCWHSSLVEIDSAQGQAFHAHAEGVRRHILAARERGSVIH